MKKILIIEDDMIISKVIEKHLLTWGFDVMVLSEFNNILELLSTYEPHLILLDINLPYKNGYHICQEIRKTSKVPIIFISSVTENMSIVMAMNMGGDDFIAKPFDLDVLTAKINALLRRSYEFSENSALLTVNDVHLNLENATVKYKDSEVTLTKNEFVILRLLMIEHNKIVSRDELMMKLWNNDSFVDDNTLTVNITRLRKKLSDVGLSSLINTRKNLGYSIND